MFHHRRQRQVPAATPTDEPGRRRGGYHAQLNIDRCEPDQPADRGGSQELLYRGLRELRQGHHESVLQGQHGDQEPSVSRSCVGGGEEVFISWITAYVAGAQNRYKVKTTGQTAAVNTYTAGAISLHGLLIGTLVMLFSSMRVRSSGALPCCFHKTPLVMFP